jgi:hypothetical protein
MFLHRLQFVAKLMRTTLMVTPAQYTKVSQMKTVKLR